MACWCIGFKSELYHALQLPILESEPPAGYFKQLTEEQLATKVVKGYPKRKWQRRQVKLSLGFQRVNPDPR